MREDVLPIVWRCSPWALAHGVTLMLLSGLALAFTSSLPLHLSERVELWVIGPHGSSEFRQHRRLCCSHGWDGTAVPGEE